MPECGCSRSRELAEQGCYFAGNVLANHRVTWKLGAWFLREMSIHLIVEGEERREKSQMPTLGCWL